MGLGGRARVSDSDLLSSSVWRAHRAGPGEDPPSTGHETWIPATVPGTAALAWSSSFGAAAAEVLDVDASDWWFATTIVVTRPGPHRLDCQGIATIAEVHVDGQVVATSSSMWLPVSVDVDLAVGPHEIAIVSRALRPLLDQKRPRPRWRSRLVADSGLRWFRTSLLGRMPALAPIWAPAGPWRPVHLTALTDLPPRCTSMSVRVDSEGTGVVEVEVAVSPTTSAAQLHVGELHADLLVVDGVARGRVEVPDAPLWWPHAYGTPHLVDVVIDADGVRTPLRRIGFRTITADTSDRGFALSVNGVPVFARGAVWSPTDPVGLRADVEVLRQQLGLAVSLGATMLRVVGTTVYESQEFWDLCDELGLLVWQDAMLATLDPPDDPDWLDSVREELRVVLVGLQGRPSLAVVCGGTETVQQPTMFGLDAERCAMPVIESVIPAVVEQTVPGTPYVTSSPSGGDLPTHNGAGVAHWFGVGGYRRPVEDTRRASVRFASECLAFATPPERWSAAAMIPGGVNDPMWAAGVPADRDTDWDFLDVTDHYVSTFFGEDSRSTDVERGLDLRRAAAAHAMAEVFSEWRRDGSTCAGGLVLEWRDRLPGPGWGLLDHDGVPKATWHVLRRVLAPVAVLLTDEGLDGLRAHLVNDGATAFDATLQVTLIGRRGSVEQASAPVRVPARGVTSLTVDAVLGGFRDVVHAYGFGEPQYSAISVRLLDVSGAEVASTTRLLPDQRVTGIADPGLSHVVTRGMDGWQVEVSSTGLAPWVVVESPGHLASDSWFHLLPGETRIVRLVPIDTLQMSDDPTIAPQIQIRSLVEGNARIS